MGYGYRRTEIGVSVGFTTEFFPWICYIWVDKSVIEGWFVLHLDGAACASGEDYKSSSACHGATGL